MQRSQEAAPARAVLSAELYLAGQEQHAIRAAGGPARDAPEGGQLQAAAELVNEWVELAIELEKAERAAAKQGHGD